MRHIVIGETTVGDGLPPYVIAEIGVNHNGDLAIARELVRRAAEAGANAVKFQTFRADNIVTKSAPKALYQQKNTGNTDSQYTMLKSLEIPEWWYPELMGLCVKLRIGFISTPYDVADVEFLHGLGVDALKAPSAWAVEPEYLEVLAGVGVPVLLSTGMCTINEVAEAVDVIAKHNSRLVILHCTTDYPATPEDCNVRVIQTLNRMFPYLVGFSDHSQSHISAILAVALGACVVERHFTLDTTMSGPDHSSSDTPEQLAALVRYLRFSCQCLGRPEKRLVDAEYSNRTAMRRSIVAARSIPKGRLITREDLAFKRPAIGIAPKLASSVIGGRALCTLGPDQHITFDMVGLDVCADLRLEELNSCALPALKELFELLDNSADSALFHPHPFTPEYAERLCAHEGCDYYGLAVCNDKVAGYAMLRGWEEGYAAPTVGLYVVPAWRGKGLARGILELLKAEARQRGAGRMMAKVYESNITSLRAFRSAGYAEDRREGGEVYLYVTLG